MTVEERERLAALEVKVQHLTERHEDSSKKVDEMHAVLMQAKGARWAVLGMATLGGAMAGFASKWLPMFQPPGPGA